MGWLNFIRSKRERLDKVEQVSLELISSDIIEREIEIKDIIANIKEIILILLKRLFISISDCPSA